MGENAEIFERLARIEQTVARIDERTARHGITHDDHERRIRALERDNDRRNGASAPQERDGAPRLPRWAVYLIVALASALCGALGVKIPTLF